MDANLHVDAHGELLGTSQLLRPSRLENVSDPPGPLTCSSILAHTIRRSPEVTRVPPLLQLLRPDAGYKGPPFASTVTTRSRRRLEDLDGCKPARGCTW